MKALWHCTVSQTVEKISCIIFNHSCVFLNEEKAFRFQKAPYNLKFHLFSVCLFSSLSYKTLIALQCRRTIQVGFEAKLSILSFLYS